MANSLTISNVEAGYGSVRVLHDVTINVGGGETVVLLGSNGNGKSTLIKCVTGLVEPDNGEIIFESDGEKINLIGKSPEENTGIALFNPSLEEPVDLELVLHAGDGRHITRIYLTLEPRQHLARYMDEAPLFQETLSSRLEFVGHTIIRSMTEREFAVISFLQDTTTGTVAVVNLGMN